MRGIILFKFFLNDVIITTTEATVESDVVVYRNYNCSSIVITYFFGGKFLHIFMQTFHHMFNFSPIYALFFRTYIFYVYT